MAAHVNEIIMKEVLKTSPCRYRSPDSFKHVDAHPSCKCRGALVEKQRTQTKAAFENELTKPLFIYPAHRFTIAHRCINTERNCFVLMVTWTFRRLGRRKQENFQTSAQGHHTSVRA
jgi:hypothetical protein